MKLAELHCHLEGGLHLPTLWSLAQKHDPLRYSSFEELKKASTVEPGMSPGFKPFLAKFDALRFHYGSAEDICDLAYQSVRAMNRAAYREIRFSPVFFARRMMAPEFANVPVAPEQKLVIEAAEAVIDGVERASKVMGAAWGSFLTSSRHFGFEVNQPALELLDESISKKIHGLDLAGNESLDASAFVEPFLKWKRAGKMLTIHAGEDPNSGGPRSVVEAIEIFKADRIGHGVRASEDWELVRRLAAMRIPLEICPTSNLQTRAVASEVAHPLKRMFDAGVNVSISTDDPTICGTTLEEEYAFARRIGFSDAELEQCTLNAEEAGVGG